jgi:DNA-binding response OmpR family regulator
VATTPVAPHTEAPPTLDEPATQRLHNLLDRLLQRHGATLAEQAEAGHTTGEELVRLRLRQLFTSAPLGLDDLTGLIEIGRLRLDIPEHTCKFGDRSPNLPAIQFNILALLAGNAGRVITRKQITDAIWPGHILPYNQLNVAISRLRRRLAITGEDRYIRLVLGLGYKYVNEDT